MYESALTILIIFVAVSATIILVALILPWAYFIIVPIIDAYYDWSHEMQYKIRCSVKKWRLKKDGKGKIVSSEWMSPK